MFFFELLLFPLEIQHLIVAEIVHNFEPKNRIQFSMASKHCHWLVKKAKPPKIVKNAIVKIFNFYGKSSLETEFDTIFENNSLENLNSFFENFQILNSCQIFVYGKINWQKLSNLKNAIRFIKNLELTIVQNQKIFGPFSSEISQQIIKIFIKPEFFENFNLDLFDPDFTLAFVKALSNCDKIELFGNVDDRILDFLIKKTNQKNQLNYLNCSWFHNDFTLKSFENFLKV